jgi:hypothetical protein
MNKVTNNLIKLIKTRKNKKIIYKISKLNQGKRFIDNKSENNE